MIKIAATVAGLTLAGLAATVLHVNAPAPDAPRVVYTSDLPCGTHGCYVPTEGTIYLHEALDNSHDFVLAHETEHWRQHRDGKPMDECAADIAAAKVTGKDNLIRKECR